MNRSEYVVTETDDKLIRLLAKVYRDKKFVLSVWLSLENEEYRKQFIEWLENNPDAGYLDCMFRAIDIPTGNDRAKG